MDPKQPITTVLMMTEAFQQGDLAAVLRTYEPGAVVVGEPGKHLQGDAALRAMFSGFMAVQPKFTYSGHDVVEAGDVALHIAPWQMTGTDPRGKPVQAQGLSVAVLRRQADGRWLMVIDQPFGDQLLGVAKAAE